MKEHATKISVVRPWLMALGGNDLPSHFSIGSASFLHIKTFKHDFFAATGLYQGTDGKVILKIGRVAPLFILPLDWIGRILARHESRLYILTQSVPGVPRFFGMFGETGIVHEYIEGRPLQKGDTLADDFFPRLSAMLAAIHARGAAYVDLEKRENILVGDDGAPYLIDFQISWHVPANRGGEAWPLQMVRDMLQASDRYHLLKHWRRQRPDQLPADALSDARNIPFWIRWHRLIFRPLTLLRRQILVWLGARDSIHVRSPG